MENFTKVLCVGITRDSGRLYAKVQFKDGKLTITGVEGPLPNGNARGSCGQIVMSEWDITDYALGWSPELVQEFREVWNRWHLNDLKAGSPAQEQYLRDHPVNAVYPESHYDKASKALEEAGLNPDPGYLHEGRPYKYGTRWLREEVPAEVLEWLRGLPPAISTPAWI